MLKGAPKITVDTQDGKLGYRVQIGDESTFLTQTQLSIFSLNLVGVQREYRRRLRDRQA